MEDYRFLVILTLLISVALSFQVPESLSLFALNTVRMLVETMLPFQVSIGGTAWLIPQTSTTRTAAIMRFMVTSFIVKYVTVMAYFYPGRVKMIFLPPS